MLMLPWFCRRSCWKEFQRIKTVPRTEHKLLCYTQMFTLNKIIAVLLPFSICRTPIVKDITAPTLAVVTLNATEPLHLRKPAANSTESDCSRRNF